MSLFSKNKLIFVFIFSFFLTPKPISAQQIGKFNSNGLPDWVEIVNNTDTEINFSEYFIIDVAGNKLTDDYIIPPAGNCVLDYFNRLNNAGDTIYLKKSDQVIHCIKYGDAAGGQCDNQSESTSERPNNNCYKPTPTPSPAATTTPTPTPSPTKTPTPVATPAPKSSPLSINSINMESSPPEAVVEQTENESNFVAEVSAEVDTPAPEVLADASQNYAIESNSQTSSVQNNLFSNILIISGSFLILASLAWLVFSEYNKKYFENSPFN